MYILTLPGERAKLSIKIFHAENDITCTSVDVSLNPWNQKKNCCRHELSLKLWKNKNNEINNFKKICYWALQINFFHDFIKFSITFKVYLSLSKLFKTFLALRYFLTLNSDVFLFVQQTLTCSHTCSTSFNRLFIKLPPLCKSCETIKVHINYNL